MKNRLNARLDHAPDNTGKQQSRWQLGQSGNPAGCPKGSRNKLSETFLQLIADDFEAHGKRVVEKVRTERPKDYLKIVAAIIPRRMEVEDVGPIRCAADLIDDELAAEIERSKAQQ